MCAAVLSGCSTPCESVCSNYNTCTIEQRDHKIDCGTFCGREQQFEETAAKTGADACKKEFDAHISCWQTNIGEVCNAESMKCEESATAWTDCMAKFCAVSHTEKDSDGMDKTVYDHEQDQACVPQDKGEPPLPALSGF